MFYVAMCLCVGYDDVYFHFLPGLCNDSVSSSGNIALKAWMMNWKGYNRMLLWPLTQYYPRSCWSD